LLLLKQEDQQHMIGFGVSILKRILIVYEPGQFEPYAATSLVWDVG
jgi:hypothetical protein